MGHDGSLGGGDDGALREGRIGAIGLTGLSIGSQGKPTSTTISMQNKDRVERS